MRLPRNANYKCAARANLRAHARERAQDEQHKARRGRKVDSDAYSYGCSAPSIYYCSSGASIGQQLSAVHVKLAPPRLRCGSE